MNKIDPQEAIKNLIDAYKTVNILETEATKLQKKAFDAACNLENAYVFLHDAEATFMISNDITPPNSGKV